MIFYTSVERAAPNPRRVEIFLKEKELDIPTVALGLAKREHKTPEFFAKHPRGQVPALELDDGTVLTESIAICRYLDALHAQPPLFGRDALETARIDMWTRRVEMILMMPVGQVWVHSHPLTSWLPNRFPDFGTTQRPVALDAMRWIDANMGDTFLATGDFSMADIVLLTTLQFAAFLELPVPEECGRLRAWFAAASARPSAG